jgi:hypothetical protein
VPRQRIRLGEFRGLDDDRAIRPRDERHDRRR